MEKLINDDLDLSSFDESDNGFDSKTNTDSEGDTDN